MRRSLKKGMSSAKTKPTIHIAAMIASQIPCPANDLDTKRCRGVIDVHSSFAPTLHATIPETTIVTSAKASGGGQSAETTPDASQRERLRDDSVRTRDDPKGLRGHRECRRSDILPCVNIADAATRRKGTARSAGAVAAEDRITHLPTTLYSTKLTICENAMLLRKSLGLRISGRKLRKRAQRSGCGRAESWGQYKRTSTPPSLVRRKMWSTK